MLTSLDLALQTRVVSLLHTECCCVDFIKNKLKSLRFVSLLLLGRQYQLNRLMTNIYVLPFIVTQGQTGSEANKRVSQVPE